MLVGNGLIAKAFQEFQEDDRFLFFCSGVSNSQCKEPVQFEREKQLLSESISGNPDKILIYFSTCSIIDPSMRESMYVNHKLEIEHIIAQTCAFYYIFRLSNVVGKTPNPNTVLNFFYNAINTEKTFDLWRHSSRNLIDVEDASRIILRLIETDGKLNSIINVANPHSYDVTYIVAEIERYLNKKGNYRSVDKGVRFSIPIPDIKPFIDTLAIDFEHQYLPRLLEKYYPADDL